MVGRTIATPQLRHSPLLLTILLLVSCALVAMPAAQKLNTNPFGWIVDEGGKRVKLACANWPSHLQPILAEGLHKQPVDAISSKIKSTGFNCIRFTWPLYLATNDTLASRTVRQTFQDLGLPEVIAGIEYNNPSIIDLPTIEAYKMVLTSLRNNSVMVILDNHLSNPGWCCGFDDGNAFFGDRFFDPDLWIKGLGYMANLATGFDNVVGMSLRNELRGPRQNVDSWYKYMQQGAETVHAANPNVLVILSGLSYDKDLSFLHKRPVNVSFSNKLVFELHWYSFTGPGGMWIKRNLNDVCASVLSGLVETTTFLRRQGFPMFLSEFGIDQRGTNQNDNRYFSCILSMVAGLDIDFALWTLQGSYYLRQGVVDMEESFGVLDRNWTGIRNPAFLQRVSAVQPPFRGAGQEDASSWHKIMFHPLTGLCVAKTSPGAPLKLGPCEQSESWIYTPQKNLMLKESQSYLKGNRPGEPTTIGENLVTWDMISASGLHIATNVAGKPACLDVDMQNQVILNECKCLRGDKTCDPSSQWFRLVDSTRQ